MRSLRRFGVLAVLTMSLIFAGSVQAQELPRLTQGMPYEEARQMLIDNGWQATHRYPIKEQHGVLAYLANELGYYEVVDCSGTGLGLCLFDFTDAYGHHLSVSTANNDPRSGGPTVYGWRIEQDQ